MGESTRTMLVVAHTGRRNALDSARQVIEQLTGAGVAVRVTDAEAPALSCAGATVVPASPKAADGAELVIVLGGDGTLLRAAELARPAGAPLIGVNLGHVGFLAEAEPDGLTETVHRLVAGDYRVEERMTLDVTARDNGTELARTWALNEASVEKAARERMIEIIIEVDGRPLSSWRCDGAVCATPTGSTAYAFSAGGPVVWPEVEALLLVPIAAHALFARPLVVSPRSVLALELATADPATADPATANPATADPATAGAQLADETAVLWCDGRRKFSLPPGTRVEARRSGLPVRLARLHGAAPAETPSAGTPAGGTAAAGYRAVGYPAAGDPSAGSGEFTDRLVAKFGLPVEGWRGRGGHAG